MKGETLDYWSSQYGQTKNQWVRLTFLKPITIRTVRLYNPRTGGGAQSSIRVLRTTIRLFSDDRTSQPVAVQSTSAVAVSGTDVPFEDVVARVVEVRVDEVVGTFNSNAAVSLAEIEVIGRAGTRPEVRSRLLRFRR
jgi:hypothetical protein